MKRFFLIFSSIFLFTLISCGTANNLNSSSREKITFVDTYVHADGRIHTCYVFTKITKVNLISMNGAEQKIFTENDYSYNFDTSELIMKTPLEAGTSIHIEGIYDNPPKFILSNLDKRFDRPCVMKDGKILTEEKDYLFNSSSGELKFKKKMDVDTDSFLIMWMAIDGDQFYGNKIENFAPQYNKQIQIWSLQKERNLSGDLI